MSCDDLLFVSFPEVRLPFIKWNATRWLLFLNNRISLCAFFSWLVLIIYQRLFFCFIFWWLISVFLRFWLFSCCLFCLVLLSWFIAFFNDECYQLKEKYFQVSWYCFWVVRVHINNCSQIVVNGFT